MTQFVQWQMRNQILGSTVSDDETIFVFVVLKIGYHSINNLGSFSQSFQILHQL